MPTKPTTTAGQKRELRERMRTAGLDYRAVAAEFARRYRLRPRAAWREAYGWSLAQAAEQINAFKGDVGLDPGGLCSMTASHLCEYENWPGEGDNPAGRRPAPYLLAVLSRVYACSVIDLLDLADREHTPPPDLLIIDTHNIGSQPAAIYPPATAVQPPASVPAVPAVPPQAIPPDAPHAPAARPPGVAYRGMQEPGLPGSWIEHEVLMTAHEGSEHAERAEQREIGEATLEQLRDDVTRLSREYMTAEPFPLLREMRRVRTRMHDALDRKVWPRDASQLYFLLGCINCLMANVASDLDNPQAAGELARSGWAYAVALDHRPLMAQLRLSFTDIAYWHDQARRASEQALNGLRYLEDGPTAAQLHLKYARAAAKIGDTDAAQQAIAAARDAHARDYTDDLLEIGGEFRLSWASHHSLAGSALIEIPGTEHAAAAELEQATQLYEAAEPGEAYRYTLEARARIDLATARLRAGALDAAAAAVRPVLALPPAKRTLELPQRMSAIRAELAHSIFRGSAQASELDQAIEDFSRDTISRELHELPLGPS